MGNKIFIDGEAGTTGLEIKSRLSGQEGIEILSIDEELRKDHVERLRLYKEADIVFLCLPDAESAAISSEADPDTKIIDASTTHRVSEGWVYGLPELVSQVGNSQKDKIKNANRIANPGCHATGFILLIRPLVDAGLLKKDALISAHSITGYSGGGKSMIAEYGADGATKQSRLDSPGQYGLSQSHKHLPEMVTQGNIEKTPVFIPIVSDFYRGMLVSIPIHIQVLNSKADHKDLIDLYKVKYADCPLISVKTEEEASVNGFIYADSLKERDDLEIIVCGNGERITLMARYDNLGKGASGAAIQNMNIMLGLPEHRGLRI